MTSEQRADCEAHTQRYEAETARCEAHTARHATVWLPLVVSALRLLLAVAAALGISASV